MSAADDLRKALEKAEKALEPFANHYDDYVLRGNPEVLNISYEYWDRTRSVLTTIRECLAASSPKQEQREPSEVAIRKMRDAWPDRQASIPSPKQSPESGWQLVPKDPPDTMLATLAELAPHHVQPHILRRIYGQMLAASPSPAPGGVRATAEQIDRAVVAIHEQYGSAVGDYVGAEYILNRALSLMGEKPKSDDEGGRR